MKKSTMFGKASAIVTMFALAMAFAAPLATPAWAEGTSASTDTIVNAGNAFGDSEDGDVAPAKVDRDLYWCGSNVDVTGTEVKGDIIVAGMNLDLVNSKAGGSVRMAGMNLTLKGVTAENNFTIAGQRLDLQDCTANGGIYAAGQDITFTGSAKGAFLAGETVTLDGTIDGDVEIDADTVKIGPNAVVTGALNVSSGNEPEVSDTAKIGTYNYEHVETTDDADATELTDDVTSSLTGFSIGARAVGIVSTVVFTLALTWLLRRPVDAATQMTRTHAGRIFGTGAIAAIAAPIALILMTVAVVTAPIAGAILFVLIALMFAAGPFAAAAFAPMVFPNMNRYGAAAIAGAVVGLAGNIPFLAFVVGLAVNIYLLGFLIQSGWQNRDASGKPAGTPNVVATEPISLPEPPTAPVN